MNKNKGHSSSNREETLNETKRLLRVVRALRTRCPWDKKQTHRSLIPYLIEEAYETVEAIERKDPSQLKEELGDLLLQVALHAEIAGEGKHFTFERVAKGIADKMVRRHPHIFEEKRAPNEKTHLRNWSKIKQLEKPKESLLGGIPKALPSLQLAQRYGEIAASVGFDWPSLKEVFDKVKEEMGELETEIHRRKRHIEDLEMELGDLLFTLTRVAGHLKVDAERSLRQSAMKFGVRFHALEKEIAKQGKLLTDCNLEEMESVWQKIKKDLNSRQVAK